MKTQKTSTKAPQASKFYPIVYSSRCSAYVVVAVRSYRHFQYYILEWNARKKVSFQRLGLHEIYICLKVFDIKTISVLRISPRLCICCNFVSHLFLSAMNTQATAWTYAPLHTFSLCQVFAPELNDRINTHKTTVWNVQKGKRNLHDLSIKFSCFARFVTLSSDNPASRLDNKRNWEREMSEKRSTHVLKSIYKASSIFLYFGFW